MNIVETRHPLVSITLQQPLNQRDPTSWRMGDERRKRERKRTTSDDTRNERERESMAGNEIEIIFLFFPFSPFLSVRIHAHARAHTHTHTHTRVYNGSNGWKIPSNEKTAVTKDKKRRERKRGKSNEPRGWNVSRSLFPFFFPFRSRQKRVM